MLSRETGESREAWRRAQIFGASPPPKRLGLGDDAGRLGPVRRGRDVPEELVSVDTYRAGREPAMSISGS